MRTWVIVALLLLAALLVESIWDGLLGRWIAPPNLAVMIGLGLAIRIGPRRGALLVGLAGMVAGEASMWPDGAEIVAGMATGALAGWTGRHIVMEALGARWFVIAALLFIEAFLEGAYQQILYRTELRWDLAGALLAALAWPAVAKRLERADVKDEELLPQHPAARSRKMLLPEEEE